MPCSHLFLFRHSFTSLLILAFILTSRNLELQSRQTINLPTCCALPLWQTIHTSHVTFCVSSSVFATRNIKLKRELHWLRTRLGSVQTSLQPFCYTAFLPFIFFPYLSEPFASSSFEGEKVKPCEPSRHPNQQEQCNLRLCKANHK